MSNRQNIELGRWNGSRSLAAQEVRWKPAEAIDSNAPLPAPLRKLQAVVLLGGAVRSTGLRSGIGRSVVDLPVEVDRTVMGHWREQSIELAQMLDARSLPVRLVLDRTAPAPSQGWVANPRTILAVERDPLEYRGTGGVLCDLARGYQPDDHILVGNAAQILRGSLATIVAELAALEADVAIVSHVDGTPSGLLLARCGVLASLQPTGFIDLKEQALPALARRHRVEVIEHARPTGFPVRTLRDYIDALRRHHRELAGVGEDHSHMDDWKPAFSIVEAGATVHPSARLHDSVVLKGGRVEEGAVVVGSLICHGGVVRRGRMAVDQLVGPPQK